MGQPRAQRRAKREVERSRSARERRARAAQRLQSQAASRQQRRGRRPVAYTLWAIAAVTGVLDLLVYAGALDLMSPNAAVVVLGGPTVGLVIAGAIVYGT